MKRTLFIVLTFLMSFNLSNAQDLWFDAGVKGSWGPTFLYNPNFLNDANYSQQISYGYSVGGKFGFNFGYIHGITFDAMYAQNKQDYIISDALSDIGTLNVDWKNIDLYVLYRMYKTINYFELGPKFSLINSVRNNGVNTTEYYNDQYTSAVLGFGWYVFGKETFTATAGVRIEYALNDMVSTDGRALGYPVNPVLTTAFQPYKMTNPVVAQIVFEINWGLGYFAKTACSGRRHFFSF